MRLCESPGVPEAGQADRVRAQACPGPAFQPSTHQQHQGQALMRDKNEEV